MKCTVVKPVLVLLSLASAATLACIPALAEEGKAKSGLFNTRYCEILAIEREGLTAHLTVYNTLGYNDCPAEAWNTIDAKKAARQLGVDMVNLNGPRYWLLDAIAGEGISATGRTIEVNGITMAERAQLDMNIITARAGGKPYQTNEVRRDTVFSFKAGNPVFELTDQQGHVYIMQSYSQIVDKKETLADLASLGSRLKLPKGWSYATRILEKDYHLLATGKAYVVRDELANTYQRRDN